MGRCSFIEERRRQEAGEKRKRLREKY